MVGSPGVPQPSRPVGLRRALVLRPAMVDFERRRFRTVPRSTRTTLETAAGAFLDGFNAELGTPPDRAPDLSAVPVLRRGFAAEGAGMAAALLDAFRPAGGRRLAALRRAYDDGYTYLIHVGVGWAMAKLHRGRLGTLGLDAPLLRWLAYDGIGFCQSFFASPRRLRRWSAHPDRCPATCDIRYQGLGRSLWFRACGDPATLDAYVRGLPARHHGDLWSGIALAATYAGGVEPQAYERIRDLAGGHRAAAAQGAAFGAEAWRLCGFAPPHAHTSVRTLTGVPLEQAATWTWSARQGLDGPHTDATHYRQWRLRVQSAAAAVAHD